MRLATQCESFMIINYYTLGNILKYIILIYVFVYANKRYIIVATYFVLLVYLLNVSRNIETQKRYFQGRKNMKYF